MPGTHFELTLDNNPFLAAVAAANKAHRTLVGSLTSGFGAVSGSLRSVVSGMHQLNGAVELVQRTATGLASMVQSILQPAADMEQTRVAFETLVGGAEKATRVLGELSDLAFKTPFEFPELAKAGQMLIAFGEDADAVADTLRRIGDVASAVGAPLGELAEIYGKARVQNQLFAEDINQLTGRGIPIFTELARVTGRSADEIKALAADGKITFPLLDQAFRNMTSAGGKFFGMMAQQSGTWNGLMSSLSDAWTRLKTAFGAPILDSLKPILESGVELMTQMLGQAKAVGTAIGEWMTYIRGAFEAGSGWEALQVEMKLGAIEFVDTLEKGIHRVIDSLFDIDFGRYGNRLMGGIDGIVSKILPDKLGGDYFRDLAMQRDAAEREAAQHDGLASSWEKNDLMKRRAELQTASTQALADSAVKSKMAREARELMDWMEAQLRGEFGSQNSVAPDLAKAVAAAAPDAEDAGKKVGAAVGRGITWGINSVSKKGGVFNQFIAAVQDAAKMGQQMAAPADGGHRIHRLTKEEQEAKRAMRETTRKAPRGMKGLDGFDPNAPMAAPVFARLDEIHRKAGDQVKRQAPGLPDKPWEEAGKYLQSIDKAIQEKFPDLGVI